MSLGGLSTGALHPGSPPAAPVEREREMFHFLKPFLTCLLESPVKEPLLPLQVPLTESVYTERCSISRAFLYISFVVPSQKDLPPGSPHRASIEMLCFQSIFLPASKSPR